MTRVLIVDDEPLLLNKALEHCVDASFDVVVTDLKMPERGGLELLKELKTREYPADIYVVSGHGADSNRDQAKELGATECFAKPLDTDELVEAINQNRPG